MWQSWTRVMSVMVTLAVVAAGVGCAARADDAQAPPPTINPEVLKELQISESEAREILNKLILDTVADPDEGPAPLTVHFTVKADEEVAKPEYLWNFGDASGESKEASPTHTFKEPGLYTVTINLKDGAGKKRGSDELLVGVTEP